MSLFNAIYDGVITDDDELAAKQMLDDLQLAAELGKTLLERNKELENSLKQHQNIIEDQSQEIEYLTKQTVALREVNDSRLRIYEQLEVSIQDLERANHRLALENSADKKQIKNLCLTIDSLETRCDDLQKNLDDINRQLELQKRRAQRELAETKETIVNTRQRHTERNELECDPRQLDEPLSQEKKIQCDTSMLSENSFTCTHYENTNSDNVLNQIDEMTQLLEEIRELRTNYTREQRRVAELEEQMHTLVQDNRKLEQKLVSLSQEDEMRSMHDELTTLEEVRQGQLCGRCLRSIEGRARDELLMMLDQEEDDDDEDCNRSINDSLINETEYRSSISLEIQDTNKVDEHRPIPTQIETQSSNPYRILIEKFEALREVKRNPASRSHSLKPMNCLSLQEELQLSGDFNSFSTKDTDEESGHGDSLKRNTTNKSISVNKERKAFSRTPTDFSEAETSSSGFSDETSNKATQTEGIRPGSFVCTVADGENCKLSIYNDDTGHRDSRFRNVPQYLEVFDEIYAVLKKAAEDVDNEEKLPLLDEHKHEPENETEPPLADDLASNFTDDSQSVMSSAISELSTTLVENIETVEKIILPEKVEKEPVVIPEKIIETIIKKEQPVSQKKPERVLTPLKREPLEYLSVAVNVRKKSSRKGYVRKQAVDRSESPILPLSPRVSYTTRLGNGSSISRTKRRDFRPNEVPVRAAENEHTWNGNSILIFPSSRNTASPTPSQSSTTIEFRPSTASHDLHKLRKLEMSYAEVLRNADAKKYTKSSHRRK